MNKTVLIMAAGLGSRYGGFKQLEGLGPSGELFIDYSIHDALQAGFNKVVCLTLPALESFFTETLFSRWNQNEQRVFTAYQDINDLPAGFKQPLARSKPWGTGHAVWCARHIINEPFMVINADDYYGPKAFEIMAHFLDNHPQGLTYGMVSYYLKQTLSTHGTTSRGICQLNSDGLLSDIEEYTEIARQADGLITSKTSNGHSIKTLTEETLVSMNCWGFNPTLFTHLEKAFSSFLDKHIAEAQAEFYLPSVIDTLIKQHIATIQVHPTSDTWLGVTYRTDVEAVRKQLTHRSLFA
jgi:NDP-sugar pyrophosphorylase family protein